MQFFVLFFLKNQKHIQICLYQLGIDHLSYNSSLDLYNIFPILNPFFIIILSSSAICFCFFSSTHFNRASFTALPNKPFLNPYSFLTVSLNTSLVSLFIFIVIVSIKTFRLLKYLNVLFL